MAAAFLNDIAADPWVLAEVGPVAVQNVKIATFTYCDPMTVDDVVELSDGHGRPVMQLSNSQRSVQFNGWIHGLTVDRLDSGYVIASLWGN